MLEEIRQRRQTLLNNIEKGFNVNLDELSIQKALDVEIQKGEVEINEFEKAVYADTAQNRKLGRVGQEWHRKKGNKEVESFEEHGRAVGEQIKKQEDEKKKSSERLKNHLASTIPPTFSKYLKLGYPDIRKMSLDALSNFVENSELEVDEDVLKPGMSLSAARKAVYRAIVEEEKAKEDAKASGITTDATKAAEEVIEYDRKRNYPLSQLKDDLKIAKEWTESHIKSMYPKISKKQLNYKVTYYSTLAKGLEKLISERS